eukprot:g30767.t1
MLSTDLVMIHGLFTCFTFGCWSEMWGSWLRTVLLLEWIAALFVVFDNMGRPSLKMSGTCGPSHPGHFKIGYRVMRNNPNCRDEHQKLEMKGWGRKQQLKIRTPLMRMSMRMKKKVMKRTD